MRAFRIVLVVIGISALSVIIRLAFGQPASRAIVEGVLFVVVFLPLFFGWIRFADRRHMRRRGLSEPHAENRTGDAVRVTALADAPMTPANAADAVEQALVARGGRVQRTANAEQAIVVQASHGSRLTLRLLGIHFSAARRRLPMRVKAHVVAVDGNQARVVIDAYSDEGWSAYRLPSLDAEYDRALNSLVSQVRASLAE